MAKNLNAIRQCLFLLVVLFALTACGQTSTQEDETAKWQKTSPENLTSDTRDLFERAEQSRKTLGKRLMARVSEVMASKGPPGAIDACNLEASGITDSVGEEYNVEIGRTSHKLRNPDNEPPSWAREFNFIEKRVDEQVVLRKGDERLAVLTPIHLKKKCMACHGPENQIAPEVKRKLDKRYPDDRATGFREGDLRGWFWVEAPAGEST